jgi:hypothetical protein
LAIGGKRLPHKASRGEQVAGERFASWSAAALRRFFDVTAAARPNEYSHRKQRIEGSPRATEMMGARFLDELGFFLSESPAND